MKRFAIWVLAPLTLVAAVLSGLFVFSPTARLLIVIVIAGIFNAGPPPIAKGVINKEDWPHFAAASKKFTDALQIKFPVGSREDTLKSTLADQGFQLVDPVPTGCVPFGKQVPSAGVYYQCLTPEQDERRKRTMFYKWGGGVCSESISVMWSSDEHGTLTKVEGGYYGVCL